MAMGSGARALIGKAAAAIGIATAAMGASVGAALAQAGSEIGIGQSAPGQLDLQTPVTQVARQIFDLHWLMLVIITGICIFVLALLAIVILRYNRAANPKPQSWTHNTTIEVVWTAAPVVILVIIAVPSVALLQLQEDFDRVEPDVVIKATGNQWNWTYLYAEQEIEFTAAMLGYGQANMNDEVREELAEYGFPERAWKLATDLPVVVPVGKNVLVEVTASDVIHSWTVPAFGVKADGVPGRINRTWFNVEKPGVYFGQCSELCGKDHSFMPITVTAVSPEAFETWAACAKGGDGEDCPVPTMNEFLEQRDAQQVSSAAGETATR
ncbi:MAG: cytochrome c oxidase subunit II [Pseudomonadota bacterium]